MDRLTKRGPGGLAYCPCTEVSHPMDCYGCVKCDKSLEKLAQYEDAEEEGRLIVLPCKVGDTVYKPFLRPLNVVPMTVRRIVIDGIDNQIIVDGGRSFCFCDIGKTVFLTREAVEAAMGGAEHV